MQPKFIACPWPCPKGTSVSGGSAPVVCARCLRKLTPPNKHSLHVSVCCVQCAAQCAVYEVRSDVCVAAQPSPLHVASPLTCAWMRQPVDMLSATLPSVSRYGLPWLRPMRCQESDCQNPPCPDWLPGLLRASHTNALSSFYPSCRRPSLPLPFTFGRRRFACSLSLSILSSIIPSPIPSLIPH
jgi:hypothetical protein